VLKGRKNSLFSELEARAVSESVALSPTLEGPPFRRRPAALAELAVGLREPMAFTPLEEGDEQGAGRVQAGL